MRERFGFFISGDQLSFNWFSRGFFGVYRAIFAIC
jgi:hypothetical protein